MAKKINKLRYACYKANCDERFSSWQARDKHDSISHINPPPEPKEFKQYKDLIGYNNWGQDMTEKEIKHPTTEVLQPALLSGIYDKLNQVLNELKRPKTIK